MPLFMDTHNVDGGVTTEAVAQAHMADLKTQDRYGVRYLRYSTRRREDLLLVDAPDAEAANRVHREARPVRRHHPVVEAVGAALIPPSPAREIPMKVSPSRRCSRPTDRRLAGWPKPARVHLQRPVRLPARCHRRRLRPAWAVVPWRPIDWRQRRQRPPGATCRADWTRFH
jgi:hypothetical protein